MKQDRIFEIIGRQLSGQTSRTDKEELETWLAENENNSLIFQALHEYWSSGNASGSNKEKSLQRLYKRMAEPAGLKQIIPDNASVKRTLIPKYLYRVAAVLLLGTFLSWFAYTNLSTTYQEAETGGMVEKIVPFGQKFTLRLSDGSIVKLNAGSKLRYPSQFNDTLREVYLEGEAFFEVQKDASRPFLVTSGDVVTSVLGTSFNIKAFSEESLIKVALVTGKVKVSHAYLDKIQFDYTLTPNEMLTYHKAERKSEKDYFDSSEVLAWKDQTLFFENAGLHEMTTVLQRWYGKQFVINNGNVITRKFSGKFENNKSLEYVLNVLSLNSNFTYQIIDETVIIEGKP